jgi:CheY-like chemotaxis protein
LFTAYSQAELGTARRYGGTGLGLAISRRLATLMGGSIDMVSELGEGTTMILDVTLQIADPAMLEPLDTKPAPTWSAPSVPQELEPDPASQGAGARVLVVDDHPTNRMLLMSQVSALGYAAESAKDGVEALNLWKAGQFSLVLTDCNMPEMSGYDLARAIRKLEAGTGGERCPILACTANAMSDEVLHCIEAGMDAYLVKPLDLNTLMTELDRWLPGAAGLQSAEA